MVIQMLSADWNMNLIWKNLRSQLNELNKSKYFSSANSVKLKFNMQCKQRLKALNPCVN